MAMTLNAAGVNPRRPACLAARIAGALVLAAAFHVFCADQTVPKQPAVPALPTTKDEPMAPDNAGENPNFQLRYSIQSGTQYANGLGQWMSVLTACGGESPRASLLVTRPNGDLLGKPVGLFSASIQPGRARQMAARLDALFAQRFPVPGAPGAFTTMRTLDYRNGPRTVSIRWSELTKGLPRDFSTNTRGLVPLMSELLAKPEGAIVVSVEKGEQNLEGLRFRLRLTNIGTRDVIVADPRGLAGARGTVRVAAKPDETPGVMERPPDWEDLGLEEAPRDVPDEGLTIAPQQSLVVNSEPWKARISGDCLAQARWQDYLGPVRIDPAKIQAAVPDNPGPDAKALVIRGAAFSSYLHFTNSK
jgi:hypothetical protein